MRRLWPDAGEVEDVDELVAAEPRPSWPTRPWLLVNMIASLDGAVTVAGRSGELGRAADRAVFRALRATADVVLAGAGTVRAEEYGPARLSADQRSARTERGQTARPAVAVVTRSLELDLAAPLFTEADPATIVLTCEASPADRRTAAAAVAEVVVVGDASVDLALALTALADRGAAVVACEGGPHLNGELVAADLVDEWDLSVAPLLVGDRGPRSSSGPPLPDPRRYRLDRLLEGDGLLLGRWVREELAASD